jgi:hypothetical protein
MNVKDKEENGCGEAQASAEDSIVRGGGFEQH